MNAYVLYACMVLLILFTSACNTKPSQFNEDISIYVEQDTLIVEDVLVDSQKVKSEKNPYWHRNPYSGYWIEPIDTILTVKEFQLNKFITVRFSKYSEEDELWYEPSFKIGDSLRSREARVEDYDINHGSKGEMKLSPNARFLILDKQIKDSESTCVILDILERKVIHDMNMDCQGYWTTDNKWVNHQNSFLSPIDSNSTVLNVLKEYQLNDTTSLYFTSYDTEFGFHHHPKIKINGTFVQLDKEIEGVDKGTAFLVGYSLSPNARFLQIGCLHIGWVDDGKNTRLHERYSCEIIDLLLTKHLHSMFDGCAGQWSSENKWVEDNGEIIYDP